jgi:hypothetical protein
MARRATTADAVTVAGTIVFALASVTGCSSANVPNAGRTPSPSKSALPATAGTSSGPPEAIEIGDELRCGPRPITDQELIQRADWKVISKNTFSRATCPVADGTASIFTFVTEGAQSNWDSAQPITQHQVEGPYWVVVVPSLSSAVDAQRTLNGATFR